MVFVGRERETASLVDELSRGSNVVVTGRYGIGRSALVRHVAEVMPAQWRFLFVDFSRTPAKVCSDLVAQLQPPLRGPSRDRPLSFRSARARILNADAPPGQRRVLVLDDIGTVSAAKLNLLRRLALTRRYRFVVIADGEGERADLLRLRESLYPVHSLRLSRLPARASREFFEALAHELGAPWGEGEIAGLASTSRGYPLMMVEAAARAARRVRTDRHKASHGSPLTTAGSQSGAAAGRSAWRR